MGRVGDPSAVSRSPNGGRLRRWATSGALLLFLLLGLRSLWVEAQRYRVVRVPAAEMAPAVPPGQFALLTYVPVGRVRIGDVIEFRHPTNQDLPLFLRVSHLERVAVGSGYLVRLESSNPQQVPWHAELYGVAWRVIASSPPPETFVPPLWQFARALPAGPLALGVAAALFAIVGCGYAVRARRVARSYRVDLW